MNNEADDNKKRAEKAMSLWRMMCVILWVAVIALCSGILTMIYVSVALPGLRIDALSSSTFACSLLLPYVELVFAIAFSISLVWALYLYSTLRHQDRTEQDDIESAHQNTHRSLLASINYKQAENEEGKNIPEIEKAKQDEKAADKPITHRQYPYSFHQLSHTHKQWAQLWFTITVSVFVGGLMYAVFNVSTPICGVGPKISSWFVAAKVIIPNLFVYALFFIAWKWSASGLTLTFGTLCFWRR
jgi:hypothetical protein